MKALPPKISVVIPTKNEQGSIASVIEESRKSLNGIDHEIIVIDASTDNTPTEAIKAGAKLVKQIGGRRGSSHSRVLLDSRRVCDIL